MGKITRREGERERGLVIGGDGGGGGRGRRTHRSLSLRVFFFYFIIIFCLSKKINIKLSCVDITYIN